MILDSILQTDFKGQRIGSRTMEIGNVIPPLKPFAMVCMVCRNRSRSFLYLLCVCSFTVNGRIRFIIPQPLIAKNAFLQILGTRHFIWTFIWFCIYRQRHLVRRNLQILELAFLYLTLRLLHFNGKNIISVLFGTAVI